MPVAFLKDAQHPHIMMLKYEGNWTVTDYENAYNEAVDYALTLNQEVYMISDFLESSSIPPNILSLATRSTRKMPDNIALIVVINSNRFVTNLIDIAGKLNRELGKKAVAVRSLEEAYTEIANHRKMLVR